VGGVPLPGAGTVVDEAGALHTPGRPAAFGAAKTTVVDDWNATPLTRDEAGSARAGYVAVMVAVEPGAPQPHTDHAFTPSGRPTAAPLCAGITLMSKSLKAMRAPAAFRGSFLPVASRRSMLTGMQLPTGMSCTVGMIVTVHGHGSPAVGAPAAASRPVPVLTVVVLVVSHPIGTALLRPATTGTVIDDWNATSGTRAAGAMERAGYVAVIVTLDPAVPGHAQADHEPAPS
jgi:hypothetical protein